jgi:hypothetical protein
MNEALPIVMESSLHIAWDYLERTGELGDPETAGRVLLDAIEAMVLRGETRKIMLSNKAIDAYRQFKVQHRLTVVSCS